MRTIRENTIQTLEGHARDIRINIVNSLAEAGSGHLGGSLGLTDVFTCLYFGFMRHDPAKPDLEERDRLILSIGHVAPVLYATLAQAGYFDKQELLTLRKLGSRLQGHPGREHGLPGIEISSGSLGQGLSVAVGLALAARLKKQDFRVISVHGDGELQEGSVWEAAMSAAHHKLNKLIAVIDRNRVQIDGHTSEVMEIEPLRDKWRSFGWEVFECDGNNIREISESLNNITTKSANSPAVLIANTVMGKGVASIEGDYRWHGKAPSKSEAVSFVEQILKGS